MYSGQRFVDLVNSNAELSWRAALSNKWEGMPWASVRSLMGAWPERSHVPANPSFASSMSIPTTFDARTAFKECSAVIGHIDDQSACGSCWAVSTAAVVSDRLCIAKALRNISISASDLMSCCGECGNGCEGGWPSAGFHYFSNTGLVTGGDYGDKTTCQPYPLPPCEHHNSATTYQPCPHTEYDTPTCHKVCQPSYANSWTPDIRNGGETTQSSTIREIQENIVKHGSMVMTFSVYEDFLSYKSGVYTHLHGSYAGGHAVRVIGWGVESGVDYWLIANSWNEDWGDKGYFKIKRGVNECGIENDVTGVIF